MTTFLSQDLAVVATIDPGAIMNGTNKTTDYVDMSLHERCIFVIATATSGATVNAALYGADTSGGSNPNAISGYSLTQFTSGNTDQAILEINARDCTQQFVACKVTISGGSGAYVTVVGFADAEYQPASQYNLSTVEQIVTPTDS